MSGRKGEDVISRGGDLAHTTILRRVQRYIHDSEKQWQRYLRPVGSSWSMDETYIKVRGEWKYLYRAVDMQGHTVDSFLSEHRGIGSAKQVFTYAIDGGGPPEEGTVDANPATHRAVAELKESGRLPPQALYERAST